MVVNAENGGMLYKMSNSSLLSSVRKNYRMKKPAEVFGFFFLIQLHLPIKKKKSFLSGGVSTL